MPAKQKVVIIGTGIAGLACAIRLAVHGYDVSVFERNNYAGGKIGLLKKDGYCFDTGPSLMVQPGNILELFELTGENFHQYFDYEKINITGKYFYEDGTSINAYSDKVKFAEEFESKTGEPASKVIDYLYEAGKKYNKFGEVFLNNSIQGRNKYFAGQLFKSLPSLNPAYFLSSLHTLNKKYFQTGHAVQFFDRFATYIGSSPYKVPSILQLISHVEMNEGVYYPFGGMISIANALYALAIKKKVEFHFSHPVQQILISGNKVAGIKVNNKNIPADIIISNADIHFTYAELLKDKFTANRLLKNERSSSALVFYWGIKEEFPQLGLHNIFFSEDYKEEFRNIFHMEKIFNDPTVYINITSKMEPGLHAPAGSENWFVMINVSANPGLYDVQTIAAYKKIIIKKLSRMLKTGIEHLIETESVLCPKLIEIGTSAYAGALYGASSNSCMPAFFRHPNFSKKIQGLYFAGGSVHPGGGIPSCLKSAKITSGLILQNEYKQGKYHL